MLVTRLDVQAAFWLVGLQHHLGSRRTHLSLSILGLICKVGWFIIDFNMDASINDHSGNPLSLLLPIGLIDSNNRRAHQDPSVSAPDCSPSIFPTSRFMPRQRVRIKRAGPITQWADLAHQSVRCELRSFRFNPDATAERPSGTTGLHRCNRRSGSRYLQQSIPRRTHRISFGT